MERRGRRLAELAMSGAGLGAEWNGGGLKSWRQALACGHLGDSLAMIAEAQTRKHEHRSRSNHCQSVPALTLQRRVLFIVLAVP
jgi:hypothetical protein